LFKHPSSDPSWLGDRAPINYKYFWKKKKRERKNSSNMKYTLIKRDIVLVLPSELLSSPSGVT
jgi:hypothetical protein